MSKTYPDIIKPEDLSIALLWANFAGVVLPPNASAIQREEMKKAFYAGFTEGFKVLDDYANALSEEQAVALLTRLAAESHEFYLKMMEEHGP